MMVRRPRLVTNALRQALERVEDFEPWPSEVSVIPSGDRESVTARRRCDVAVLDRHALADLVEKTFLLCPDVGH